MKKYIHILFITLIIFAFNIDTLNAQVKSIKTISTSNIDGKSHLSELKKFDKKGNLTLFNDYDSEGKLESTQVYKYTDNKLVLKTDTHLDFDDKEITKISYNNALNTKTTKVYRNDNLAYEFIETFDKNKNLTNISQDIKGDKHNVSYKYILNEKSKIIEVKSITNDTEERFKTFKYNNEGKEIEVCKIGPYLNYKTSTEYKNGKIYRILKTRITKDLTEYVESDISFDEFFNPIYQKIYNEEKLIQEHKMTYTFDKKGNWISKIVTKKDLIFDRSNTFKPNYTETRKIKYW